MPMQLTLKYISGSKEGQLETFQGNLFNLGTRDDNDIVFTDARCDMSGYHAQIRQQGTDVILHDMGSAAGTWRNEERVIRTIIKNGDRVRLAKDGPSFFVEFEISNISESTETSAPPLEKIYGQRTVGLMIEQALRSANVFKTGVSRSTAYFEAILEQKLHMTTRTYRRFVLILLPLLLTSMVLSVLLISRAIFPSPDTVAAEEVGAAVVRQNRKTVFLLAGLPRNTPGTDDWKGFCTAFAIGKHLLATNAHCVETARDQFTQIYALQNESPQARHRVIDIRIHPAYRSGQMSPDMALLRVEGALSQRVRIATPPQLTKLETGRPVFMYGFPETLSDLSWPIATFTRGEIGRTTTLDHRTGTSLQNVVLQHSAITTAGTSGSPLFDADGRVIGINIGGYRTDNRILPGYNIGLRIDLLSSLYPEQPDNP